MVRGRLAQLEIEAEAVGRFACPGYPGGEGVGLGGLIGKGEAMGADADVGVGEPYGF